METSQPSVVVPSPWVQRALAIVGAFLLAYCVGTQVLILLYIGPTFQTVSRDMGVAQPAVAAFVTAWRWPLLILLAATQAAAILLAVWRRPYGTRLLIGALACFMVTMALVFSFGLSAASGLVHVVSSLQSK